MIRHSWTSSNIAPTPGSASWTALNNAPATETDSWTSPKSAPVPLPQSERHDGSVMDPCHIWKVICNAPSNRSHPPTSPNIERATNNDSHGWPLSHMKGPVQCAEQQESPSNIPKYCACHKNWHAKISKKFSENGWKVILTMYNARPIRDLSKHDLTMIRAWTRQPATRRNPGYFSRWPQAFSIKNTTFRAPATIRPERRAQWLETLVSAWNY